MLFLYNQIHQKFEIQICDIPSFKIKKVLQSVVENHLYITQIELFVHTNK